MELQAQVHEDLAGPSNGQAETGLKHWAIFAGIMMKWPLQLFSSREPPTQQQVLEAEQKLLVFGRWLGRSYLGDSVVKYVGDVKRAQRRWMGVPLQMMGVNFCRLPMLLKILRKEKPGSKREKTPWPVDGFARVRAGTGSNGVFGLFGGSTASQKLERESAYVMMLIAFEQLLRSDELVDTGKGSAASSNPLMLSDVTFEDRDGKVLDWEVWQQPAVAVLRMPPSKTDQQGTKFDFLRMPFPVQWELGNAPNAAGPALWRYVLRRQVPVGRRGVAPLLAIRTGLGPERRLTATIFQRVFKELCTAAVPPLDAAEYGLHCFRVGGMNLLMDLGASAPQICALGRWSSECWQLYARRQRKQLMSLTEMMACAAGSSLQ